jgi:hypothetical protein
MLLRQGFDIRPISTADGLHLLQITDTEDQKFNAVITDSNVFPIRGSISRPIGAAAKKRSTQNRQPSKSDETNDFDPTKPKRKNYNYAQPMASMPWSSQRCGDNKIV